MLIKGIKDECMNDFKQIGMLVVFPNCNFKCDKEYGQRICQNSHLANAEVIEVPIRTILVRYYTNPISSALICGGLEPLDSIENLYTLIETFRFECNDPVVIYTGYTEEEAERILGWNKIKELGNIYVKYGRFIPNQTPHYDEVLGVKLASNNQYGKYYE